MYAHVHLHTGTRRKLSKRVHLNWLEKRNTKVLDILRKLLHHSWRQAGEKSRTGRVKRSERRKTSVENSSQCSAAEQLPACTTGIPSSGLSAGNRNAPAINAGRKKTRRNPVLSVEVFLHSASIYTAQLKERSSLPVWMPIYIQQDWTKDNNTVI